MTTEPLETTACATINEYFHVHYTEYIETIGRFSIIWNIFETKFFEQDAKQAKIESVADEYKKKLDLSIYEDTCKFFHNRYKSADFLKGLFTKDEDALFSSIRNTDYDKIDTKDKIYFVLTVAFRFRCNLFHGNKVIDKLNEQIMPIKLITAFLIKFLEFKETQK